MFQSITRLISTAFFVFFAFIALLAAGDAASYHYRDPIVFCREQKDPATGKVLFASKLWVMESDGSHARQLTTGITYDDHPSFYSDREHVLYSEIPVNEFKPAAGARLMRIDIYTGVKEVVAAQKGCALHHASISPLGDLIAYHHDCGKRQAEWVGLGSNAWEVNTVATNGVAVPDGIIFMSEKNRGLPEDRREVALARIYGHGAGSRVVFLTGDRYLNRRPAISPDGKLLAWQTNQEDGVDDEIFLANIDGSNARDITRTKGYDGHPWFSRDGKSIVFESSRTGIMEIWRIDLATGRQTQLTNGGKEFESNRPRT